MINSENKLDDTFRKIEAKIHLVDLYDRSGNKLDGKYISPASCIPNKELFDRNGQKVFKKLTVFSEKQLQICPEKKLMI